MAVAQPEADVGQASQPERSQGTRQQRAARPTPTPETNGHAPVDETPEGAAVSAVVEDRPEKRELPFKLSSPKRADRYLKLLVYGPYGAGKTTFAASAADVDDMNDVIFIDAEAGDLSIEDREEITTVRIENYDQFSRIYEYLQVHCGLRDTDDVAKLIKTESRLRGEDVDVPCRFRTVIIDSLSEVHKMLMYKLLGIKPGVTRLDKEPNAPEFKEWGQAAEMMRLLIRTFRDLSMNVIFVCSEGIVEDEGSGKKIRHRHPNLPGKLGTEVEAFTDVCGYITKLPSKGPQEEDVQRPPRLYITPGRTFDAKNRFGTDVAYIDDPTLADILDLRNKRRSR